jgi:PAS domain S-box-containing protein
MAFSARWLLVGGTGVALAAGLGALAWFAGWPSALAAAALAGLAAAPAVLLTRRHYERHFRELMRSLRLPAGDSSSRPLLGLEVLFAPLGRQVDAVVAAYGRAMLELARLQDAAETSQLLQSRPEDDGASLSGIRSSHAVRMSAGHFVARLTPTLHWLSTTPALQQFLGYSLAELKEVPLLALVPEGDRAALTQAFQDALRHGEGHDITFRLRRRGLEGEEERHVQLDVLTRYANSGTPLHFRCHFLDVTARVRNQRELRRRTEQLSRANHRLRAINADLERLKESYRDLYHLAPVMYFSLDPHGVFAACNDTMLHSLGFSREELLGQPYAAVLTPEARARFLQDPELYHRPAEVETRWRRHDGSDLAVWIRTTPVLDEQGRFVRSRSAAQDVTERNRLADAVRKKAEELGQANAQLRRINRELDDFTYVVSHDLKEPLRSLQSFSTLLAQDCGPQLGPEGQEHVRFLVAASRRMGALIDDLLALSRAGHVIDTPRSFETDEVVRTALADLSDLIQRCGATSERPEVVVGAEGGGRSGGYVTFFVRDNGIGIDPRHHEKIFGIFKRAVRQDEFEGTGAGLAICKKIVEAHGGRIWVESQPGQGATFYFTLPAAAGQNGEEEGAARQAAPVGS